MTIHREGRLFLLILAILLVAVNWGLRPYLVDWLFWLLVAGSVALFFFFGQFFRSPVRNINISEDAVVSPADGKIVVIEKVLEDEFFNDERIQVSIFMSPLNVHLNRVPFDGVVDYYKYHPGKYLVAFHPKSSKLNERNTCVMRDNKGRQVLMRQIAGAVARRIRFYLHEGQRVKQGEELGFIKFGSRMDLFLPVNTEIAVEMGQAVKAGIDVIAKLK
jgi:phosphatidylserine decarboxylase